jgi:hypothetical protein
VDEAEIAVGGFIVAGSQPSGILELVEAAFDHVAQDIDCGIDGYLDQPVPFCRDHGGAAALLHIFADKVGSPPPLSLKASSSNSHKPDSVQRRNWR